MTIQTKNIPGHLTKRPSPMLDHRTVTTKTAVPFAGIGAWSLSALRGMTEKQP